MARHRWTTAWHLMPPDAASTGGSGGHDRPVTSSDNSFLSNRCLLQFLESEVMGRNVVRWELITIGLTLFAILYSLGYLLLSPRSNRPLPLTPISEWFPSPPPDSSQPTH
jgi:hypothetical protein